MMASHTFANVPGNGKMCVSFGLEYVHLFIHSMSSQDSPVPGTLERDLSCRTYFACKDVKTNMRSNDLSEYLKEIRYRDGE